MGQPLIVGRRAASFDESHPLIEADRLLILFIYINGKGAGNMLSMCRVQSADSFIMLSSFKIRGCLKIEKPAINAALAR